MASRPDAASARAARAGRPHDPCHVGAALARRPVRVRPRRRCPAKHRHARRVLRVRFQPAAPLSGRERRGDLERAELGPFLAASVRSRRHEPRTGSLRGSPRAMLGRPARPPPGSERDRRLVSPRQRQPVGVLECLALAGQLLSQARRGISQDRPPPTDSRHDRAQPVSADKRREAMDAPPGLDHRPGRLRQAHERAHGGVRRHRASRCQARAA